MQQKLNESNYLSNILNYIDTLSSQNDLLTGRIELIYLQTENQDFLKNTQSILAEIKNKLSFLRSKIVALDKNFTLDIILEVGIIYELETLSYTINTLLQKSPI